MIFAMEEIALAQVDKQTRKFYNKKKMEEENEK